MAKRKETVATLRKQLADVRKLVEAEDKRASPYRSVVAAMFTECFPGVAKVGRSRGDCHKMLNELTQVPMFNEMVECCNPDTVGYVITDAVRIGMEMGKRLHESKLLEEMVRFELVEVR